jgi:hypothetical protein
VEIIAIQYSGVIRMSNTNKNTDPNAFRWGFTLQSENWNGRFAMVGFLTVVLIEVFSKQGFLHFWGIL